MNYLDTKLEYYSNNIENKRPIGVTTLSKWLKSIRSPNEKTISKLEAIQTASKNNDLKTKTNLKKELYSILGAVRTNGVSRTYENIDYFTGLCFIDFDNLEQEFAKELKEYLFHTYDFIVCAYLSVSGKGVKVIARIPVCKTVEEYKSYYYGMMADFQMFRGIDFVHQNAVLLSFLSYDKDVLVREDATISTARGFKIDAFGSLEDYESKEIDWEVKSGDKDRVKNSLRRMMAKVDEEGFGHPIVKGSSLMCGGWIAGGYLEYNEGIDYMHELIDNSEYLQKDLRGYKRTCIEMINYGMKKPLKYE